ncbi:non-specific lethal 1 [Leptinotarsa decemlineata]|uniref:non-specific lethal 1 n=1 Tax=Leptinotarsa decemlineata TaxID=7539 RepID=UPI003D30A121
MGLRTASLRHTHAEVMAPALTETVQTQNFDLPPKSCLEPDFPKNSYIKNKYFNNFAPYLKDDAFKKSSVISETTISLRKFRNKSSSASDNFTGSNFTIMNFSPSSMGDQENKMGLQKTDLNDCKDKNSCDMQNLLNNLSSVLPETDAVSSTGDLGNNVEDIMQVIKSIEGNERLNSSNDLNSEGEEIFTLDTAELTNNLSSFEKELLENVDVMDMSIEDQQDELDTAVRQKESQANEVLLALQKKHAKEQRRLDFLKRRVFKLQSRLLGQHVASEIAGVFENVHRNLKKPKEVLEGQPALLPTLCNETKNQLKPMSYSSAKTLVRKLEMSANLQANTIARQKTAPKYFGSGSIEIPMPRNSAGTISITPWSVETKNELQKVARQLKTQTHLTQKYVDSEATESSSGGESCDEMQTYNNPHQQYLSVQKRAFWKYAKERGLIAARWTWIQAQISDLEYRIRQHTDWHKQIRANKVAVKLGGSSPPCTPLLQTPQTTINGYCGQLPGSSPISKTEDGAKAESSDLDYQCARTRPLVIHKKRKLLQVSGLHAVSRKAARPSTIRCGCVPLSVPCAVCTGRTDPTHPRDPPDTMSKSEKVSLLDPSFHPVFSMPEDTSQKIHFEAVMKTQEWQQRSTRMKSFKVFSKSERAEARSLEHRTRKIDHRKKYGRMLKPSTITALSAKIRNKIRGRKPGRHPLNKIHRKRHNIAKETETFSNSPAADCADEEIDSIGTSSNAGPHSFESPSSSPLLHMHSISGYKKNNRALSYDIDNIVIPYSVAASTRVEKLPYKEILTPKWRIAESEAAAEFETKNNGAVKEPNQDSDIEDLSEESVINRHDRCEYEEKKRFLSYLKMPTGYGRTRVHKRTDSRAESSGANTPDPMSPHNIDPMENTTSPMTSPPATPLSLHQDESSLPAPLPSLPSIAVMRRRTMSQSRFAKDKDVKDEAQPPAQDVVEVAPYDRREFPIGDETYEKMLEHMPENHQFQTNAHSQDSAEYEGAAGYMDRKVDSPDSESTESAIGEGEEDPNDPEWIDMEGINRDRYKR